MVPAWLLHWRAGETVRVASKFLFIVQIAEGFWNSHCVLTELLLQIYLIQFARQPILRMRKRRLGGQVACPGSQSWEEAEGARTRSLPPAPLVAPRTGLGSDAQLLPQRPCGPRDQTLKSDARMKPHCCPAP